MLVLAISVEATIFGVALALAIGHVIDIRSQHIKHYFLKRLEKQKPSENFIFLIAYYTYVLGLSTSKTSASLMKLINTRDPEAVESLFVYYLTVYIPKHFSDLNLMDKKMQEAITTLENGTDASDKVRFFELVEKLFDDQTSHASMADISILKKIAENLDIDYTRDYYAKPEKSESSSYEYSHTNQQHKTSSSSSNSYSYKKSESVRSTSPAISQEVKSAFKELGFSAENPPNLTELKREYRKQVRKYHPDILKGRGETEKKLKQAEEKLSKLNKSMDIAKNFLANN